MIQHRSTLLSNTADNLIVYRAGSGGYTRPVAEHRNTLAKALGNPTNFISCIKGESPELGFSMCAQGGTNGDYPPHRAVEVAVIMSGE